MLKSKVWRAFSARKGCESHSEKPYFEKIRLLFLASVFFIFLNRDDGHVGNLITFL